jgi:hypothetical protein
MTQKEKAGGLYFTQVENTYNLLKEAINLEPTP